MSDVRELVTRILFKLDKNSVKNADRATDAVKKNLSKAGDAGEQAARRTGSAFSRMASSAAAANGAIKGTMRSIRDHIRAVGNEALATGRNMKNMVVRATGKQASDVGGKMVAGGAAATAAGASVLYPLKTTVDAYKESEYWSRKIQAVTNTTAENMKSMDASAEDIASKTRFTVAQIKNAQYNLAVSGLNSKEIVSAMPSLIETAIATDTGIAETSQIVISTMRALNAEITTENVRKFGDIFSATMNTSAANLINMGETMKYAASLGGAFEYTMEDLALATGLMANRSIDASMAGTTLRALFSRLAKPTKEVAIALQAIGVEAVNADGSMKPLRQLLKEMRGEWGKLTMQEQGALSKMIAGQYGISGFQAIMSASKEEFERVEKGVDNAAGTTARMFKEMEKSAKNAEIAAGSAVDVASNKLGRLLLPVFVSICEWVQKAANVVSDFADKHPKAAKAILIFAGAIGSLLAVLGSLLLLVGGVVMGLGALATALGIGSIGALVAALGPVALAILAIIAALALLYVYWDDVKKFASDCIDVINRKIDEWKGKIKEAWDAASNWFGKIKGLLDGIADIIDGIVNGIASMSKAFDGAIQRAESGAMEKYYNYTSNQTNNITVGSASEAGTYARESAFEFDDMP